MKSPKDLFFLRVINVLIFLIISFFLDGTKVYGQTIYDDYYASFDWKDFLALTATGGGSPVTVEIEDNVLTVVFNASFASNYMYLGKREQLHTSPTLPDMTLGTIEGGYTAYIEDGWLSIGGTSYEVINKFIATLSKVISPYIKIEAETSNVCKGDDIKVRLLSYDYGSTGGSGYPDKVYARPKSGGSWVDVSSNIKYDGITYYWYVTAEEDYEIRVGEPVSGGTLYSNTVAVDVYEPRLLLFGQDQGIDDNYYVADQGENIVFDLNFAGATSYSTIKWYKNGVEVSSGSSTYSYSYNATEEERWQAGFFNYEVGCEALTNSITIKPGLHIVIGVDNSEVCAGETVKVLLESYYTESQGGVGYPDKVTVRSKSGGSLEDVSSSIQYDGSHYYWNVLVEESIDIQVSEPVSGGSIYSNTVTVDVYEPRLLLFGQDQGIDDNYYVADQGENIVFDLNFAGATSYSTIKWYKNGVEVSSGPSTYSYSYNATEEERWQAGFFNYEVGCEALTNSITIKPGLHIVIGVDNSEVCAGETVKVLLESYYTESQGGVGYPDKVTVRSKSGGSLEDVSSSIQYDGSHYYWNVLVEESIDIQVSEPVSGGSIYSNTVTVNAYQPRLLLFGQDQGIDDNYYVADQGENIVFDLNFAGATSYSTIKWYKNGVEVSSGPSTYSYSYNATEEERWQAGFFNYEVGCEALTNSITIKPGLHIVIGVDNSEVCAGETVKVLLESYYTESQGGVGYPDKVTVRSKSGGSLEDVSSSIQYDGSHYYWNVLVEESIDIQVSEPVSGGSIYSNTVTVNAYQPRLLLFGQDQGIDDNYYVADQGENIVFDLNFAGATSYSTIKWYKNGVEVSSGSSTYSYSYNATEEERWQAGFFNYEVGCEALTNSITIKPSLTIKPDLHNLEQNFIGEQSPRLAVSSESELSSLGTDKIPTIFTYFDGLGRPNQTVHVAASTSYYDVTQPIVYDGYGRESVKYLPYAIGSRDGMYISSAVTEQPIFYSTAPDIAHDNRPYVETIFEPSPLNRVEAVYGSGSSWSDKPVSYQYLVNAESEVVLWDYATLLTQSKTYYGAGELYKSVVTDEDDHTVMEYKDKLGKILLKKSLTDDETTEWASTYYIYDDFDLLQVVIPPEAFNRIDVEFFDQNGENREAFLDRWAFQYEYDGRNRMTLKKVPGAEPVFMVYDQRDRLVLTQDGEQRLDNEWLFTKYDALNRPIMTGVMESMLDEDELEAAINAMDMYETFDVSGTHQYSDNSFPANEEVKEYLTITYYDNYAFVDGLDDLSEATFSATAELTASDDFHILPEENTRVKGQVTGTKTKVLDTDEYLETITYYDDKYRVIQVVSENEVGGTDVISSQYDFVGNVRRVKSVHTDDAIGETTVLLEYDYDHTNRLLSCDHQLNDSPKVRLYTNEYNELGELIDKKLHSTDGGSTYSQSVDYTYNIRGWLERINEASMENAPESSDVTLPDVFGMELYYNEAPDLSTN